MAAEAPTANDVDDGSRASPLLDRIDEQVTSLTGDDAYDRDEVHDEVAARHPGTAIVVPPRSGAAPGDTAETAPIQRDRHPRLIAERGRLGWQRASGYNRRALVEADVPR